jgi:4-amino-4-deoxy-L-arabinose transferase-like glycosyltransferase
VIKSLPHILLIAIVLTYVVIGTLYAIYTPIWQIPDEPAHYNYVRQLAEGQGLPVMEMGDYDQDYLDRLRGERFPPELSIDSVTYEDHQPPLYYLLATPVYVLSGGQAVPLRLLSVVFGAALLAAAFATIQAIFPARPALALVATALIAFIPQHVAMTAGVNNDTLGELVLAIALWVLVVYLHGGYERPWPAGLVLAAALLTKGSIYTAVPLIVVGVALRWRLERRTWQWAAGQMAWILIPALLLSAPWFIRNGLTYGFHDVTGQVRHGEVVQGQLTTGEFLAEHGWGKLLSDMARTTFNSFWGQFGWMAVPLQARFYRVLLAFTLAWATGFAWWLFDRRRPRLTDHQRASLLLLLASSLLSVFVFLGYNVQFLQHQGRYLFPALIPIGTAVALGLDQLAGILPKWARSWALGSVFAAMALFAVYCLFRVVVPFLS